MNDYWGISLIGTGLKILTVLISVGLNRAFEKEEFFSKAQAGFRRLEKCVALSAYLLETSREKGKSDIFDLY